MRYLIKSLLVVAVLLSGVFGAPVRGEGSPIFVPKKSVKQSVGQQRQPPRQYSWNLFDFLFSPPQKPAKVSRKTTKTYRRLRQNQKRFSPKKEQKKKLKSPRQFTLSKSADASSVVVVGDSLAGDLQRGLAGIYSANHKVRIIDYTEPNTGLTGNGMVSLKQQLQRAVYSIPYINMIIVMSGFNDRVGIPQGYDMLEFESVEWQAVYTHRLIEFMEYAAGLNIPVVLVSLPPPHDLELTRQIKYLNKLQLDIAGEFGIEYINTGRFFGKRKYPYPTKATAKTVADRGKLAKVNFAKMLEPLINKKINTGGSSYATRNYTSPFDLNFSTPHILITDGGNASESVLIEAKSQESGFIDSFDQITKRVLADGKMPGGLEGRIGNFIKPGAQEIAAARNGDK